MQLVFIHGAGCTGSVFHQQLEAFSNSIALTLPGHTTPGEPERIDDFADFVAGEFERRKLDNVVLVGHSMGSAIALEVALRQNPRVAGLLVLGGGAKMRVGPQIFDAIERDFETASEMLAGFFFADGSDERRDATIKMMRSVGKEQTLRDFRACNAFDVTSRTAGLPVPLLAFTGELDVMMPPKFAMSLADRVPGGQARILPGAGHFAMIEYPAETNEAIRTFVTQIER